MKDVLLTFRPYRSSVFAAYFGIVIEMGYLLILGGTLFNLQQISIEWFLFILFCVVLGIFMIKYGFDGKKITIYFTEDGLHLINDIGKPWQFMPWSNFTYMYTYVDSKCRYCVLSSEEKDRKQLKKIIRSTYLTSQITVENAVVFPLDLAQKVETVTKIIEFFKKKNLKILTQHRIT